MAVSVQSVSSASSGTGERLRVELLVESYSSGGILLEPSGFHGSRLSVFEDALGVCRDAHYLAKFDSLSSRLLILGAAPDKLLPVENPNGGVPLVEIADGTRVGVVDLTLYGERY